jgi:hypothetical protein
LHRDWPRSASLAEAGCVEGKNFAIEYRFTNFKLEAAGGVLHRLKGRGYQMQLPRAEGKFCRDRPRTRTLLDAQIVEVTRN